VISGHRCISSVLLLLGAFISSAATAQVPLQPDSGAGLTITPVFEGWYGNPDGTYSLVFGYYNRNYAEALDISIGPDNFVAPGAANQGQPTHFQPRRHWGVFAITVAADFGYERVVWTLKNRGKTFAIPGSLNTDWQIDALAGEAGSGNTPPRLRIGNGGREDSGPGGRATAARNATVGQALQITVWAADDGKPSGAVTASGKQGEPVTLTWSKHQGPGDVTFSAPSNKIEHKGGEATTSATFSEPGEYVIRILASDASGIASDGTPNVAGAGHAQCCWTNAFVQVSVAP
jgi:hypothetical protein